MKQFLNNYFGFNKQQRNGLMILLIICGFLFLVRVIMPFSKNDKSIALYTIPEFARANDSSNNKNDSATTIKNNLFVFNPNNVSLNELLQLGFSEKAAKVFLNFRNKGFVFKKKEDLKKVYGISEKLYLKLESYILIQEKTTNIKTNTESTSRLIKTKIVIELNAADSLQLESLNGIGPSYAKRILKYRTMLGGFISKEQLLEVYGFNEELYNKIKDQITINQNSIVKLNLKYDDFKTINKHPYFSYEVTKQLFNTRRKVQITPEILKEVINNEDLFNKLIRYVEFD
ncbi:MAG: helix-hairpin-helix domain-containing protein [Bacteroidetes bacterium]|nr:helix-hairpin-helix domain-containing protein [Bacteroidota bacterium]